VKARHWFSGRNGERDREMAFNVAKGSTTPATKADRKALLDVGAWLFNVTTSVGIIMVNKQLMANYDFRFGTPFSSSFSYC